VIRTLSALKIWFLQVATPQGSQVHFSTTGMGTYALIQRSKEPGHEAAVSILADVVNRYAQVPQGSSIHYPAHMAQRGGTSLHGARSTHSSDHDREQVPQLSHTVSSRGRADSAGDTASTGAGRQYNNGAGMNASQPQYEKQVHPYALAAYDSHKQRHAASSYAGMSEDGYRHQSGVS
jgi:hypothetical protein